MEELPEKQEDVLVLRTGTGISQSHDRRQAARILHVSLRREGQLEQHAVSRFNSATKRGCPALEGAALSALSAAAAQITQLERLVPAALGARRRHPGTKHRSAVQAAHKPRHAVSGATATVPIQRGAVPALTHSGSSATLWLLLGAGLLAATALGAPVARRRLLHRPALAGVRRSSRAGEIAAAAAPAALTAGAAALAGAAAGERLEREGDVDGALAAYRRADAAGDPRGATNLGVLLERRGDLEGAAAAYRRADERGDVNGSFNLGCLLAERGDVQGAMAALRRADERGDPAAASNLGVLLERHGHLDGALQAYRRADERGDANGAFNLGLLLASRSDLAGARAAYERAAERGEPEVSQRARSALLDLERHEGS